MEVEYSIPPVLSPSSDDGNDFNADFSIIPLPERRMRIIVTDPKPLSCDYDPHTQPKSHEPNYFGDLFEYAHRAINYYNETHPNDDYFLVDPLALKHFRTNNWRDGDIHHLSFVARSIRYSHSKLFFAEFAHLKPQICTIVDPGNPLVRTRCDACHPDSVIYHPPYDSKSRASALTDFWGLCSDGVYAKKYLRDVYTITSTVEELDSNDAQDLQKKYEVYACEALMKFNRKNDVPYELVGLVACNRFVCEDLLDWAMYWAHLTFMAKVKDGDGFESSSVLFFAELRFSSGYFSVTTCVIIPTGDDSVIPLSGNGSCCAACRDIGPMLHPERNPRNPETNYKAGYKGGDFADSMYEGRFRAVKSKVLMKDDDASHAARKEFYYYLWSRGAASSQRRAHSGLSVGANHRSKHLDVSKLGAEPCQTESRGKSNLLDKFWT